MFMHIPIYFDLLYLSFYIKYLPVYKCCNICYYACMWCIPNLIIYYSFEINNFYTNCYKLKPVFVLYIYIYTWLWFSFTQFIKQHRLSQDWGLNHGCYQWGYIIVEHATMLDHAPMLFIIDDEPTTVVQTRRRGLQNKIIIHHPKQRE